MKEKITLPEEFIQTRKPIIGENWNLYLKEYEKEPIRGLQVNTLKIDIETFKQKFTKKIEPIPYTINGFYLEEELKAGKDPLHHAGSYYVQEPSAMIVANSLSIKKDSIVLDVCSAPGGKTIGISNQLQNTGLIVANEINPTRAKILLGNIERMGISNCVVTNFSADQLNTLYTNTFDYIFLDTPCSGEGMFRKDEQAVKEWSLDAVENCSKRSLELLETISSCLKTGGYLIYSTCTFAKEENEDIIENFLSHHSYQLLSLPESIQQVTEAGLKTSKPTEKCRRFYPYTSKGEGQFVAVLQKQEEQSGKQTNKSAIQPLTAQEKKIVIPALKEMLSEIPEHIYQYKGKIIYYEKEDFSIPPHQVLSVGVTLGTIEKNRFIPHHQFFTTFGKQIKNQLNLEKEDIRVKQYLTGYEIENENVTDGWGALLIEGCPTGGFKASKGKLKNHYPKGLRIFSN